MLTSKKNHKSQAKEAPIKKTKFSNQEPGILSLPLLFMVIGIVFLVIGSLYENSVLRFMGLFWFPGGLLCLVLVLYFIKREKKKQ